MEVSLQKSHGRRIDHGYFNQSFKFNQQGITLLELMVTLTILALAIIFLVPNIGNIINSSRVTNELNQFSHGIRYAWTEAIYRNQVIVACPSPDGEECVESRDWSQGWLVFVDENDNRRLDDEEPIQRVYQALPEGISATLTAFGPRGQYIPFYPTEGMRTNGTFRFCVKNSPELNRALIVSKARPRISQFMRDGDPVTCPE